MKSALFATREQFAQEARECALRRDEFGYAWDVRDVGADGERGEREGAEGWWHWDWFQALWEAGLDVAMDELRTTKSRSACVWAIGNNPGSKP